MEQFNVWEHATNREEGSALIAQNIEKIKEFYAQCIFTAETFDIRLSIDIDLPDGYRQGHNQNGLYGYWSASAADC